MDKKLAFKHEFLVSKLMFKNVLNTKWIKDKLGKAFTDSVQSFVTNHIEYFSFYSKLNLKHNEESTNSAHEESIVLSSITQYVLVQIPRLKNLWQ